MLRRRARPGSTPIDLFPFLSMFLCIFGVLSFLQIVMASSTTRRVVLVGDQEHALRAPVQVFCNADGVVVIPPVDGLRALENVLDGDDRLAIERIRTDREARRRSLTQGEGGLASRAAPLTRAEAVGLLTTIRDVNRVARQSRHPYEEFVLFGVYPDGADAYHSLSAVAATGAFRDLSTGVEVLDSDFQMAPLEQM